MKRGIPDALKEATHASLQHEGLGNFSFSLELSNYKAFLEVRLTAVERQGIERHFSFGDH